MCDFLCISNIYTPNLGLGIAALSCEREQDRFIYIIYTPNLGLGIACFDQEKEQGRFRGNTKGAGRAQGEHE